MLTVGSYVLLEQPVRRGGVITRDRVMAPVLAVSAAVVAVVAVSIVPSPPLTDTELLLALGEQEVVDFATTAPAGAGVAVGPSALDAVALDGVQAADVPAALDARADAVAAPSSVTRVVVLGSDAAVVETLDAAGDAASDFDVVDAVRSDCPLSSADTPGCERLLDRWSAVSTDGPVDVVVIGTSDAETQDAFSKKLGRQSDEVLQRGRRGR